MILRIDTLCLEGIYSQWLMGFSQLIFGLKHIPQVEQNIVLFILNLSSVKVKDGQMSMIEDPSHSPKKCKFEQYLLALPPQGDCNYLLTH
jgi:hypothetical protein